MKEYHKKGAGFTMMEMLVVIFIIGVMSSILVVNWRKNEQTYLVQRTAQEIAQNIRKAQDLALTSKKYSVSEDVPSYYGINFATNNPTSYFIFADKNGNKTYQPSDFKIDNKNILISSGVQIDYLSAGNNLDIAFSIPDGFTYVNGQTVDSTTIRIKKTGATCPSVSCRNIIIRKTGQISIQ
jgi:prepilin-type N-terminal cleavage/methylation domain-containing protein